VSGFLTTGSTLQCPHGGTVSITSTNTQVQAADGFILRSTDVFTISGCSFATPATGPLPCATVQWVLTALQSQVLSEFNLTEDSVGLCMGAGPPVPVMVTQTQSEDGGI
jgi:hypothetical protein